MMCMQDCVRQGDTGRVTGLTNSCSILAGLAGNLCTGVLAQTTGSYQLVFAVAIALYISSWWIFTQALKGQPIHL